MSCGYLYCFYNPSMPEYVKIGMTMRSPLKRLAEANIPGTFMPPLPYEIAFAKKVVDPKEKEKKIHARLEKNGKRVDPRREFFRMTLEDAALIFDLMDGEEWVNETAAPCKESTADCEDDKSDVTMNSDDETNGVFIVEDVRSKTNIDGKVYYEVKWAGYPESANKFIPFCNFNAYMKKYIKKNKRNIPICRKPIHSIRIAR